jgi:FKBP-type peptidyl-prolyl cis-trans isomerase
MFNKYELIGGGISVLCMATALFLLQVETNVALLTDNDSQLAQLAGSPKTVVVEGGSNKTEERTNALMKAVDANGKLNSMVIDDIKIGTGAEVKAGDTVSVHYIGTLQDGTEFDSSKKRGTPFEFTVGEGRVIKGWEEGLLGMKTGGERILVIPPDKGYGEEGIGPIPGGATLVFAIELLEIK